MAEKTYIVRATRFGHMLNRSVVEKAAEEGRIVPPVVEYLEQGAEVKLDDKHRLTERALAAGDIEEPGAAEKRREAELQAELDRIKAQQEQLEAQRKSLKG